MYIIVFSNTDTEDCPVVTRAAGPFMTEDEARIDLRRLRVQNDSVDEWMNVYAADVIPLHTTTELLTIMEAEVTP